MISHIFHFRTAALFIVFSMFINIGIAHAGRTGKLQSRTSPIQQSAISGTIKDTDTGEPLAGVSVTVKGTTIATISGLNGDYSVLAKPGQTLIFSHAGYQTVTLEIQAGSVVNVSLSPEASAWDQEIFTGYFTERKKNITGSVDVLNMADIPFSPVQYFTGLLQGRVAGLYISSPGIIDQLPGLTINGVGLGSYSPVVIIDGVPGNVADVNPADVESITFLKDAASSAILGSRANGGAIVVTTKQGTKGFHINAGYNYGVSFLSPDRFPEMLDAEEYGELIWKQMEGAGYGPGLPFYHPQYGTGSQPVIPEYVLVVNSGTFIGGTMLETLKTTGSAMFADLVNPDNYNFETHQIIKSGNTDWFDEMYNPAPVQSVRLAASGGNDVAIFALTAGYHDRRNISDEYSYFRRYTLRANSSVQIAFLKIGENFQFTFREGRIAGQGDAAWRAQPLMPVYDIAGNPAGTKIPGMSGLSVYGNPVVDAWRKRFDCDSYHAVLGNIYAEVTFLRDFIVRSSYGVDYNTLMARDYTLSAPENNPYTLSNTMKRNLNGNSFAIFQNTLRFSKSPGLSNINIIAGMESENRKLSYNSEYYNVVEEDGEWEPEYLNLHTLYDNNYSGMSWFGRGDFTYAERYLLSGTYRTDRYDEDDRQNTAAVSLGWLILDESFMSGVGIVDALKIRGSMGMTDKNGGENESNHYLNGGVDVVLDNGNLAFIMDIFKHKYTRDLTYGLSEETYPFHIMYSGINFSIIKKGSFGGSLKYELTGVFNRYKNQVEKLGDDPEMIMITNNTSMGNIGIIKKGYPANVFYGYKIEGFFNSQSEVESYDLTNNFIPPAIGRWRLSNTNGDQVINNEDRTILGDPNPDFQFSFNMLLKYRNFDFSAFLFWNQGGEIFNYTRYNTDFNTGNYNRSARMLNDSWTPDNQDAKLPALNLNDLYSARYATDYFIEDATFVKLKQIQLGYTLPVSLDKSGKSHLRVYVQAENIWTWSKEFSGIDPETQIPESNYMYSQGIYYGSTPPPQQVLFGINLSF